MKRIALWFCQHGVHLAQRGVVGVDIEVTAPPGKICIVRGWTCSICKRTWIVSAEWAELRS